jgi:hypothetical protein
MESRQKMEWDIQSREEEAAKNNSIEIAIDMLNDGEPIEKIIKYTKLTHEEIEELRNAD